MRAFGWWAVSLPSVAQLALPDQQAGLFRTVGSDVEVSQFKQIRRQPSDPEGCREQEEDPLPPTNLDHLTD